MRQKITYDAVKNLHPTFNEKKDRGVVIPGLGVNLSKALQQNTLPTGEYPVHYNSLAISEVSGRINDKFDMLRNELKYSGAASSANSGMSGAQGAAPVNVE